MMRIIVAALGVVLLTAACGAPTDGTTAPDPSRQLPSPGDRLQLIGEADTADASVAGSGPPVVVTDVRLGAHGGFDRIVFELAGDGQAGWQIGYTDETRAQGSGSPIAVPGDAVLALTLTNVAHPADAPEGVQPWDGPERQRIAGTQTLTTLVQDALFEGRYSFFAGLTERQPFAVGRLSSPPRVVIDVLTQRTQQPAALTERCESPEGFDIAYPASWSVNSGDTTVPCTRFAPDPFSVRPETDARVAPIVAYVEPVRFSRVATPDPEQDQARAATVIDGRQAVRIERTATGDGLYPEGTRITSYFVDLSPGADDDPGVLIVNIVGLPGFDYTRNTPVLDRMVRTLQISSGPPADDAIVGRYEGGDASFSVTATRRGERVCLRLLPRGESTCLAPPRSDRLGTATLPLGGDRRVTTGLAGGEVFRVQARQPDGDVVDVLPAPVPDSDLRGFAFPFGPDEIERLSWYDLDGHELGSRPG